MTAPKSIVAIMREVALELRQRARSMGRGELPRFLYREAAKLIEAMETNHVDETRSGNVDAGDRRPADTGDAGAGNRPCPVPFPDCGPQGCPRCGGKGEIEDEALKSKRAAEEAQEAEDYSESGETFDPDVGE